MALYGPNPFQTPAFAPLSFRTYTKYFLIPHIACALIIADESNEEGEDTGAWEHMVRGADLGEQMNPLQDHDPEYEKISADNAKHWKRSQKEMELGPSALPARMRRDDKVVSPYFGLISHAD